MSQVGDGPLPPTDLLAVLDPDPVRAEARYGELRSQLVRFFEWQRHSDPEDAAQETLARGFRRVAAGVDTSAAGVHGYFFGIARNLVKEGKDVERSCSIRTPGSERRRRDGTWSRWRHDLRSRTIWADCERPSAG